MPTEIIKVPCSSNGEMVVDLTWKRDEPEYSDRGHVISRYDGLFAHAWGRLVGKTWDKLTLGKHDIVIYQWDKRGFWPSFRYSSWRDIYKGGIHEREGK